MASCRVTLGRVAGVFGVKGWLRLHAYTREPAELFKYRRWWLTAPKPYEAEVLASKVQGDTLIAQLSDAQGLPIEDRDVAASLIGSEIQIEREQLPALPQGEYYWVDLLGSRVESVQGEVLGEVVDLTSNGAQDVMVIQDGDRQRLIPFVEDAIVREVNLEARRIVCDWRPEYG